MLFLQFCSNMNFHSDPDVIAVKEWLAKETYLPNDLEDLMIKKFLHSCYGSLEKTKQCIDKFCSGRYNMPEMYTSRDPCSVKLQTAASISYVATFEAGENEILIQYLEAPTLDKFDFYDVLKSFGIQADYWIKVHPFHPEGHIVIMDIKYVTLKIIPRVNIFFFQKLLIFLLEAMPVRLKQVHVINCPSYYEKLYALVKAALPQDIINLINFHTTHEGLYSFIDKKYLPQEYGGDAKSFKEQHQDWMKRIENERKLFLTDNLWKADMTKKSKINGNGMAMNGSFKSLSID